MNEDDLWEIADQLVKIEGGLVPSESKTIFPSNIVIDPAVRVGEIPPARCDVKGVRGELDRIHRVVESEAMVGDDEVEKLRNKILQDYDGTVFREKKLARPPCSRPMWPG